MILAYRLKVDQLCFCHQSATVAFTFSMAASLPHELCMANDDLYVPLCEVRGDVRDAACSSMCVYNGRGFASCCVWLALTLTEHKVC